MDLTDERIETIRNDFPILHQEVHGKPLVYLDNGATTQVPSQVLDTIVKHYQANNANVHRGIHTLSERSTAALEQAREKTRAFLNADKPEEIVFTKGTTDAINLIARSLEQNLFPNTTVAVSALEHHANFVPWQQACKRTGAKFAVIPLDDHGDIDIAELESLLNRENVTVVAVTHVSNVTGTVNPVERIAELARQHGALILVDAAQSIRHEEVDVKAIDCDFLCFSGHKMLAPTGIGVLYGRYDILKDLDPVEFGGEMVGTVQTGQTTFETPPLRFEAGTPNYVGAIALGSAIDYLSEIGRASIRERERKLLEYAEEQLASLDSISILGNPKKRGGCLSFSIESVHPFDLATLMDTQGIALRSGSQCAQPLLHETYGIRNITRLTPAFYNTFAEIDACTAALRRVVPLLQAAAQ